MISKPSSSENDQGSVVIIYVTHTIWRFKLQTWAPWSQSWTKISFIFNYQVQRGNFTSYKSTFFKIILDGSHISNVQGGFIQLLYILIDSTSTNNLFCIDPDPKSNDSTHVLFARIHSVKKIVSTDRRNEWRKETYTIHEFLLQRMTTPKNDYIHNCDYWRNILRCAT